MSYCTVAKTRRWHWQKRAESFTLRLIDRHGGARPLGSLAAGAPPLAPGDPPITNDVDCAPSLARFVPVCVPPAARLERQAVPYGILFVTHDSGAHGAPASVRGRDVGPRQASETGRGTDPHQLLHVTCLDRSRRAGVTTANTPWPRHDLDRPAAY
jgi:hypothetical protein